MPQAWTPYALEPLRRDAARRRRGILLALMAILALSWTGWSLSTKDSEIGIGTAGGDAQIQLDPEGRPEQKPVTVGVAPGGTAVMSDALSSQGAAPPPAPPPRGLTAPEDPYAYTSYVIMYGPLIVAAYLAWRFLKSGPSRNDELNFGIYKGALPLEMMTHSSRNLVFTTDEVDESIFGKNRADYVSDLDEPPRRLAIFESVDPARDPGSRQP